MLSIRFGSEIASAAAAHHLDPRLLAAVAAQETGGPGANSGRNIVGDGGHGHGIFQIDDRSWAFARTAAAMDPAANADAAATILADDLHRYGGNVRAALSAYNSGSPTATGTTTRWGDGEVLGYADSVLRHYANFTEGGTLESGGPPIEPPATPLLASNLESGGLPIPMSTAPGPNGGAFTPISSWSSLNAAGQSEERAADSAYADIISQSAPDDDRSDDRL